MKCPRCGSEIKVDEHTSFALACLGKKGYSIYCPECRLSDGKQLVLKVGISLLFISEEGEIQVIEREKQLYCEMVREQFNLTEDE